MGNSEYVEVDCDAIETVTDRAVLMIIEGENIWVPRSAIEDGDEIEPEDVGPFYVRQWFCDREGIGY